MKIEEFIKAMNVLTKIYKENMDKETLKLWYGFFNDIDIKEFKDAVQEWIKTKTTFPTIAALREIIANKKTNNRASAEEEWNHIIELVRKYGYVNEEKALNELDDFTKRILKKVDGFISVCMSSPEDNTFRKKDFVRLYNAGVNQEKESIKLGIKIGYTPIPELVDLFRGIE